MEVDRIDLLLERYLHLLHEYTTLREQLSTLQTGMYQNIARANFAAERGMRFGQDFYDERMQASRKLAITPAGGNDDDNNREHIPVPVFAIAAAGSTEPEVPEKGAATATSTTTTDDGIRDEEGGKEEEEETREPSPNKKERRNDDPLRWFGLLTPMPLRQAQAQSIQAVEQVIPKLVSVNAQMAQVEIEVRRARKKRAKAEAAAIKQEQGVGAGAEITA